MQDVHGSLLRAISDMQRAKKLEICALFSKFPLAGSIGLPEDTQDTGDRLRFSAATDQMFGVVTALA